MSVKVSLKMVTFWHSRMSAGNEFQTDGAIATDEAHRASHS